MSNVLSGWGQLEGPGSPWMMIEVRPPHRCDSCRHWTPNKDNATVGDCDEGVMQTTATAGGWWTLDDFACNLWKVKA